MKITYLDDFICNYFTFPTGVFEDSDGNKYTGEFSDG